MEPGCVGGAATDGDRVERECERASVLALDASSCTSIE